MSWSVDTIFKSVLFLVRKNMSGSISPDDFFFTWNIEQNAYFQDITGRWEARANGKQGANTGLIRNETILSDLAPFTISDTVSIIGGEVAKPTDFFLTNSMRIGDNEVTHIDNTQISSVRKSVLDAPSVANGCYYYTEYEDYYYLLPTGLPTAVITDVTLDYVAYPEDVRWGYVFNSDNRPVYNSGLSVQPKWKNPTLLTITKRALSQMGITFKDSDFANFGKAAQLTGN